MSHELQALDFAEKPTRRGPHPLGVNQVTGIVVTHPGGQSSRRRHKANLVEPFANVAHLRGQVLPAAGQPLLNFAERGAAARRVAHHRIQGPEFLRCERGKVLLRQFPRRGEIPGVGVERTTTSLLPGHDDVVAVLGEHAHGGAVHVAKEFGHHAPFEQGNPPPAFAPGRGKGGQTLALGGRGNPGQQRSRPPDEGKQQACEPIEREPLGETEQGDQAVEAPRMNEDMAKRKTLQPRTPAPSQARLGDRGSPLLEHRSELNARRALALARSAAEAKGEFFGKEGAEFDCPLRHAAHEIDAAAGRTVLTPGDPVGRTRAEAEPAMHAIQRTFEKARFELEPARRIRHLRFAPQSGRGSGSRPDRSAA